MQNNYNILEVIKMAINIEKEGFEYYSRIAKHTVDEKSKAIFIILAEQEKKHIDTFSNLLETMASINKTFGDYIFDENVSSYFNALTEHKVFKPERMYDAADLTNAKEAIHEGIEAEKNSILFYNEVIKNSSIEDVNNALNLIIEEEKKHIIDLYSLMKSL